MLTSTLRALERDGLVRREVLLQVPVSVESSLTALVDARADQAARPPGRGGAGASSEWRADIRRSSRLTSAEAPNSSQLVNAAQI
jgi:hypothetical protein